MDKIEVQSLTNLNFNRILGIAAISSALLACVSLGFALQAYLNPGGYAITSLSGYAITTKMVTWTSLFLASSGYFLIQQARKNGICRQMGAFVPQSICQKIRDEIAYNSVENDGNKIENDLYSDKVVNFSSGIKGYWFPQVNLSEASTVILFSGYTQNNSVHHMDHWVQYYQNLGLNVCLVDPRGYGLNQGVACKNEDYEAHAYQDACAALDYALGQGIDSERIIVHGYSQGGPIAASLSAIYPSIKAVILDHTHPSVEEVIAIDYRNYPSSILKLVNLAAHPLKKVKYKKHSITTNGWNTANRVKNTAAAIFVLEGSSDKNVPPSKRLLKVRYGKVKAENHLVLEGDHFYQFSSSNEVQKLQTFVTSLG